MLTKTVNIGPESVNIGKAKVLAVKELENTLGCYLGTENVTFQHIHATPDGYCFTVSGGGKSLDVWVELERQEFIHYPDAFSGQPLVKSIVRTLTVKSFPA